MPKKKSEGSQDAVVYDPTEEPTAEDLASLPRVRLNLQPAPGRRMISLRLREDLLKALKEAARRKTVPYQVLIQMWLEERLHEEAAATRPEPIEELWQLVSRMQDTMTRLEAPAPKVAAATARSKRKR